MVRQNYKWCLNVIINFNTIMILIQLWGNSQYFRIIYQLFEKVYATEHSKYLVKKIVKSI